MGIRQTSLILFISMLIACDVNGTEEAKHVRIDAALSVEDPSNTPFLYLIAGDEIMHLVHHKREFYHDTLDLHKFLGMNIQAAFATPDLAKYVFFGKDQSIKQWVSTEKAGEKEIKAYGPHRKFLRNGGPDAAAKKGNKVYFFKGCEMAGRSIKSFRWGKSEDMEARGLPCDVDAAWSNPDGKSMVILKGNQIWKWKEDDTVEGPTPFHDSYDIVSWVLDPVPEE